MRYLLVLLLLVQAYSGQISPQLTDDVLKGVIVALEKELKMDLLFPRLE